MGGKGYKPRKDYAGRTVSGDWEDSDRGSGNKSTRRSGGSVEAKSPTYLAHVHNKGKKKVDPEKNPVVGEAKVDDVKYGKGKGWDQPDGKSMTKYSARHSYLKKNPANVRSDRNKRHSEQDVVFHGHDKVERDRKAKHHASKGVKKVKGAKVATGGKEALKKRFQDQGAMDEGYGTVVVQGTKQLGKLAVRQGIKVGGKAGGYAVKKAGKAAAKGAAEVARETGRGALEAAKKRGRKAGEEFVTNVGKQQVTPQTESVAAPAKKPVGKGEKVGKLVGSVAGGMAGGAAVGGPTLGVGAIAGGVAGSVAGEKVGGAIGKGVDKVRSKFKKENFSDWRNDLTVDEAKVDAGKSPEEKEKVRNVRKFGVSHNVAGHGKLRRSLHKMNRGDKKIPGDKSAWVEMEAYRVLASSDGQEKPSQFSYKDEKTAKKYADSIKKGGGKATVVKEDIGSFRDYMANVKAAKKRQQDKQDNRKNKDDAYIERVRKGIKFYDKKGSGRMVKGRKVYDKK